MSDPLIQCDGLLVRRGGFTVGPVTLDIRAGVTSLVGVNGAGKSTLLRGLVGLERPATGFVRLRGLDPHRRRDLRRVMAEVGYVPQDSSIPGNARVRELIAYAAWLKGVRRRAVSPSLDQVLAEVSISSLADRKVGDLSGGERQRVSIAMALVHRPPVLILDEPTAGLDPVQRVLLRQLISGLSAARAVLVSTHLVEDLSAGGTVVVLHEGRIAFHGTTDELRRQGRPEDLGSTELERGVWRMLGAAQR